VSWSCASDAAKPPVFRRWLPDGLPGEFAMALHFDGLATGDAIVARRFGPVLRNAQLMPPVMALAARVAQLRGWSPGGTLVFARLH
jgi:hypothetical protein